MLANISVFILFFMSGASILSFELVWTRLISRILGQTPAVNTCVLSSFMAGSALGAIYFAKQNKWHSSWKLYGIIELLAGLSALLSCWILSNQNYWQDLSIFLYELEILNQNELFSNLLRFLICFLILIVPTALMSATFSVINRINQSKKNNFTNKIFSLTYMANALGASTACIVSGFFLIQSYGLLYSALIAASCNITIFLCSILIHLKQLTHNFKYDPDKFNSEDSDRSNLFDKNNNRKEFLDLRNSFLLVGFSGSIAIILELNWMREFCLVFGSSVYSNTLVLFCTLLAIFLGTYFTYLIREILRWKDSNLIPLILMASSISIILANLGQELIFIGCQNFISSFNLDNFQSSIFSRFAAAFIIIVPPLSLLSSLLPLSIDSIKSEIKKSSKNYLGELYAFNSLSAASAALAYNFILVPLLVSSSSNMISIIFSICAISILLFSMLFLLNLLLQQEKNLETKQNNLSNLRVLQIIICFSLIIIVLTKQSSFYHKNLLFSSGLLNTAGNKKISQNAYKSLYEMNKLIAYKDGLNATTALISTNNNSIFLTSNGKVESCYAENPSLPCLTSDINTHITLAALPVLLSTHSNINALLIGLGSGITASVLLSFPEIHKLKIIEIEKSLFEISPKTNPYNPSDSINSNFLQNNLENQSLKISWKDARFDLSGNKKAKYELICSQAGDPWVSGSADLYSVEFFQLIKSRLKENGIFCQWIPTYELSENLNKDLIYTLQHVFPNSLICHNPAASELLFIGFNSSQGISNLINSNWLVKASQKIAASSSRSNWLARANILDPYDCLALLREISSIERRLLTDKKPILEFASAKELLSKNNKHDSSISNTTYNTIYKYLSKISLPNYNESEKNINEFNSLLARALLRQAMQETPEHRMKLLQDANDRINLSLQGSITTFALWQKYKIKKELDNAVDKNLLKQALKLQAKSNWDHIAKFDIYFLDDKIELAKSSLELCDHNFRKNNEWKLRDLILDLKLNLKFDKRILSTDYTKLHPTESLILSYILLQDGKEIEALNCLKVYLTVNPWDAHSQALYAILSLKNANFSNSLEHAIAAIRLDLKQSQILLPLLSHLLDSSNNQLWANSIDKIQKINIDPEIKQLLKQNQSKLKEYFSNPQIQEKLNSIIIDSVNPNYGYKILVDP